MEMEKWCCNKIQNIESFFAVRKKKKLRLPQYADWQRQCIVQDKYIYILTHIYIYLIPLCTEYNTKTQQFNKEWLIIYFHSAPQKWCCGTMYMCYWVTVVLSELQRLWAQAGFTANIAKRNCQKLQHFQILYLHTDQIWRDTMDT